MDRAVLGTIHPYPGEVLAAALQPVLPTPAPPENLTNVTPLSPAGTLPGESSWAPREGCPRAAAWLLSLGNNCKAARKNNTGSGQSGSGPLKTNMARQHPGCH